MTACTPFGWCRATAPSPAPGPPNSRCGPGTTPGRCTGFPTPPKTSSTCRACPPPPGRPCWKTPLPIPTPPWCAASTRPAWCCWARRTRCSLPSARRVSTTSTPRRTTPGTPPTTSPAAPAAARALRWAPGWCRPRWAPTPAARCAFPPPCAAPSASRRRWARSAATACFPSAGRWIPLARWCARWKTPPSCTRLCAARTRAMPPPATPRRRTC